MIRRGAEGQAKIANQTPINLRWERLSWNSYLYSQVGEDEGRTIPNSAISSVAFSSGCNLNVTLLDIDRPRRRKMMTDGFRCLDNIGLVFSHYKSAENIPGPSPFCCHVFWLAANFLAVGYSYDELIMYSWRCLHQVRAIMWPDHSWIETNGYFAAALSIKVSALTQTGAKPLLNSYDGVGKASSNPWRMSIFRNIPAEHFSIGCGALFCSGHGLASTVDWGW